MFTGKFPDNSAHSVWSIGPEFHRHYKRTQSTAKRMRSHIPGESVCACAAKFTSDYRALHLNDPVDRSSDIMSTRTSQIFRGSVRTNSDSSTIAVPAKPRLLAPSIREENRQSGYPSYA